MHNDVELDGWVILGFSDYFLVALEDTPAARFPVAGAAQRFWYGACGCSRELIVLNLMGVFNAKLSRCCKPSAEASG